MGKTSLFHLYLGRFKKFYFKHRIIPSMNQCMEVIGVHSKSVVHRFFQQMIKEWYLEKKQWIYYPADKLVSLPLFDSVRAWWPAEATQEQVEMIGIDSYLVPHPEHSVLLSVAGDSMINVGLHEWDMLVVDIQKKEKEGDIVIALIDGGYTVKTLLKDADNRWFLRPENDNYDDIYPNEWMGIYGVVVWSFRTYL